MLKMDVVRVNLNEIKLVSHPEVYEPAEDSFLLAENLLVEKGNKVLDMGTGSGILAICAAKMGGKVIGADINPYAVETAKKNADINSVKIEFRVSDLFQNISEKFDLIIFNFPYLPVDDKSIIGRSWSADNGVIENFFNSAPSYLTEKGRIEVLLSSLTSINIKKFKKYNFIFNKIASKKMFFEEIYVLLGEKINL